MRVAKQLPSKIAFGCWQRDVEVVDRLAFSQVQLGFDLVCEDGARPVIFDCLLDVK